MKKFAQVTVIVLALLFATAQSASAGTGTGLLLGLFLGGALDGTTVVQGNNPEEIIYQMPNMMERVIDPLEVRFACLEGSFAGVPPHYYGGKSLKELLVGVIGGHEKGDVAIIQVRRRLNPSGDYMKYATIWFAYIRGEFIRPPMPHQPEKQ